MAKTEGVREWQEIDIFKVSVWIRILQTNKQTNKNKARMNKTGNIKAS